MSANLPDPSLRQRAEEALRRELGLAGPSRSDAPPAALELVHELRVHQFELEMQNEELRRAYSVLEESRLRYFDLYDLAPVGYCTVSSTGLVLDANLTLTTLLGLTRGALKQQQIAHVIASEDRDGYYLFSRRMFTGGNATSCELRMCRSDGAAFWANLQASVTGEGSGASMLLLAISDVTERRQAAAALEQAKDDAEAAARAKSAFLANMSHEIRTPLNAILGFSHLMQAGATPEQSERLGKIHSAGQHLLLILNDVLDLSKIESGRMRLEDVEFDLPALLAEVVAFVEEQARAKGLELRIATGKVPRRVRGDPTRLRQSLLNYASNAVKFTAHGSIGLHAEVVSSDIDGMVVRLSVQDTGEGIAPASLGQLFEPFEQADLSITRRFGGTGLGLTITRRLTELMGGEVGVQSRPGVGSNFWLTVRLRAVVESAAEQPPPDDAEPAKQLAQHWAGLPVLLVDDDEVSREIGASLLRLAGLTADLAVDGFEATRMAAAGRYGLVLMDMQMPGMDGLSTARAIRGLPNCATLPIVLLERQPIFGCAERTMTFSVAQPNIGCPLEVRVRLPSTPNIFSAFGALALGF